MQLFVLPAAQVPMPAHPTHHVAQQRHAAQTPRPCALPRTPQHVRLRVPEPVCGPGRGGCWQGTARRTAEHVSESHRRLRGRGYGVMLKLKRNLYHSMFLAQAGVGGRRGRRLGEDEVDSLYVPEPVTIFTLLTQFAPQLSIA
jgi:hypothetical protein